MHGYHLIELKIINDEAELTKLKLPVMEELYLNVCFMQKVKRITKNECRGSERTCIVICD